MEIQWDKVAIFAMASALGGLSAVSAHCYRFINGRVGRRPRWFGLVAAANGVTLSLATALATDKLDHTPQAIVMSAIVTGAFCGLLGPDWVLLWIASLVDVLQEANKRVRKDQEEQRKNDS